MPPAVLDLGMPIVIRRVPWDSLARVVCQLDIAVAATAAVVME